MKLIQRREQSTVRTFEEKETLRKRRLWYYLALILLLVTALTRQPLVLLCAAFTLLVGIVPELWFRNAMTHLLIRQHLSEHKLFFGERVTLSLTIENRKLLPLPWLEVENSINPPLRRTSEQEYSLAPPRDRLINTWLLWSYQRVTRRYRMTCAARGFHVFGPVRLTCSDPFGWLEKDLYAMAAEHLLVYPLISPLQTLGLPAAFPMGERVGVRQLLEDPLWFAGNREYEIGDDPRRIDWKATARSGELRSKIYESTTERRLLILLDTWTYSSALNRVDFELQEFAICAAASLANWGLDEGYAVGLLANSSTITATAEMKNEVNTDEISRTYSSQEARKFNATSISPSGIRVPFSNDYEQYEEILSTLARLVPAYNTPIERLMEVEADMFSRGTTLLLISSANTLSEVTVEGLLEQRLRGSAVSILLVGELEKDKQAVGTYDLPVYNLGGKEKWHELVTTVNSGSNASVGTSSTYLQLD